MNDRRDMMQSFVDEANRHASADAAAAGPADDLVLMVTVAPASGKTVTTACTLGREVTLVAGKSRLVVAARKALSLEPCVAQLFGSDGALLGSWSFDAPTEVSTRVHLGSEDLIIYLGVMAPKYSAEAREAILRG